MTRAEFYENLAVALDTLRSHKIRSGLTVLGIVIGVTSVISVAAIIQGLNGFVADRVEKMGSKTYFIMRFNPTATFGRVPEKIRTRKYLKFSDAEHLRATCRSVSTVTPFVSRPSTPGQLSASESNDLRFGSESVDRVILRGVEPETSLAIPLFAVALGRFVTRYDLDHARPVVVLGDGLAASLFPNLDPIGQTVRLNGRLVEVIGVMEKDPGLFGGPGLDQIAVIPLSTFRKWYPEIKEVFMAFIVADGVENAVAVNEVIEALRRLRRIPHNGENDFDVLSPDFLSDLWNQLTGALVILTSVISSIGLLVGGIGVMNIMLISVTERTAEIGVRKAIGARRADIRAQFLMEAVTLSSTGGVLGILCGATISFLVRTLVPNVPASLSTLWVVLGVMISISVGLFFGYYPASRAANLDPVVCLRYE